jgi:hypothetical protein
MLTGGRFKLTARRPNRADCQFETRAKPAGSTEHGKATRTINLAPDRSDKSDKMAQELSTYLPVEITLGHQ